MENDYISRGDVKKLLWERISLATFMRRGIPNAMKSLSLISEELEKIPAADVRPVVYARWIELENPNYSPFDPTSQEYDLLCSHCGATHYGKDKNFCPNCGADMREEQHG